MQTTERQQFKSFAALTDPQRREAIRVCEANGRRNCIGMEFQFEGDKCVAAVDVLTKAEQPDNDVPPVPQMPEFEPIPNVRNFEVWVRIKKSSKYYHQGLVDPTKQKSAQRFFKLSYFTPMPSLGTKLSRDAYVLHFNGNAYRIEDCEIFLRDATNPKNFVRIV